MAKGDASDKDELAEINGVKPDVYLQDTEEREVAGSGKSKYKLKRTWDHYSCSCPAWRNQKGVLTDARTCKHLRALLGTAYEDARLAWKKVSSSTSAPASSSKPDKKPASTAASKPAKRSRPTEDDEDEEEAEEEEKPKKKPRSTAGTRSSKRTKVEDDEEEDVKPKKAPASKRGTKVKKETKEPALDEVDEDVDMPEGDALGDGVKGEGSDDEDTKPSAGDEGDELAEIDGIKPKKLLKDGEEMEAKSMTSSSTYKIKRTFDHYYCTCPAWRNQSRMPTDARSCKHLRAVLGDAYEDARLKLRNPDGFDASAVPKKKAAPKKKKAKTGDDDDEEGADDDGKVKVELLLASKWDLETGQDVTGWWMSEKLDGVRVYWDGKQMLSRLGNPFTPPDWFKEKLPTDVTLDGELFGGRGKFQSTVSIVKTTNSPKWKEITFQIFDVPSMGQEPFEDRIEHARKLFGKGGKFASMNRIKVLEQEKVNNRQHVIDKLKEVEGLGGEGVMLRKPKSLYEGKRSNTLLKVKTFYDAEAEVVGYEPGKGKHKGVTGSLKCEMESGKKFNVGTGLSDAQRKSPPKIGAIITYRFQELTKDKVPRFPSFIGEAADKSEAKDAEVPAHRLPGAKSDD